MLRSEGWNVACSVTAITGDFVVFNKNWWHDDVIGSQELLSTDTGAMYYAAWE